MTNNINDDLEQVSLVDVDIIERSQLEPKKVKQVINEVNNQTLSSDSLKLLFPKYKFSDDEIDKVNSLLRDETDEQYTNFLGLLVEHKHILEDMNTPDIKEYIQALKFVTYMNAGYNAADSYLKAKAINREDLEASMSGTYNSKHEIQRLAMNYAKTKLVIRLQASLDFPLHLLFVGYKYQAIEQLRKEMLNATYSKDRIAAADKLLVHLQPTLNQTNINMNIMGDKASKNLIDSYQEALFKFAGQKKYLLTTNMHTKRFQDRMEIEDLINLSKESDERYENRKSNK